MLNQYLLPCVKTEIKDFYILFCGKWRKMSKSLYDFDLDQTMLNVELIRAISKYFNMSRFQDDCTTIYWVHRHRERLARTHADGHTDMSRPYSAQPQL